MSKVERAMLFLCIVLALVLTAGALLSYRPLWNYLLGVEYLGAGYVFDLDMIVHIHTQQYEGSGTPAIPPTVLAYNRDDKFVVVATENPSLKIVVYWLIVKSLPSTQGAYVDVPNDLWPYYDFSNVLGPMDRQDFLVARTRYGVPDELTLDIPPRPEGMRGPSCKEVSHDPLRF